MGYNPGCKWDKWGQVVHFFHWGELTHLNDSWVVHHQVVMSPHVPFIFPTFSQPFLGHKELGSRFLRPHDVSGALCSVAAQLGTLQQEHQRLGATVDGRKGEENVEKSRCVYIYMYIYIYIHIYIYIYIYLYISIYIYINKFTTIYQNKMVPPSYKWVIIPLTSINYRYNPHKTKLANYGAPPCRENVRISLS